MNKFLNTSLLFAFSLAILTASGQLKDDKALQKKIIGSWQFQKIEFIALQNATEEEKASASMSETLSTTMPAVVYKFFKNGDFEIAQEAEVSKGTWKIENGRLRLRNETGDQDGENEMLVSINGSTLNILSKASAGLSGKLILKKK